METPRPMDRDADDRQPSCEEIDRLEVAVLLEFGAEW